MLLVTSFARVSQITNHCQIVVQPLRWCCVDCVIHHEPDVREEQKYICAARASNNKRDCDAGSL